MPSLILEKYELTDAHRLKEAEKWLSKIQEMFDINRSKYINVEVIFRQLVINPKMNTVPDQVESVPPKSSAKCTTPK